MKILVTGGAGFIGSNFVCYALEKGYEIINIDSLTYAGNLNNLNGYKNHPKYNFYQEDICDRKTIEKIIFEHQPQAILHMAAESHVDRSIDCADEFIRTNILGTHSMLEASLKYYREKNSEGFRFLHLSTDEVFGALGIDGQFDETMPYLPNSPYAASKASSDLLVRSYHKTYGLPTVTVNASNNYGPKQYVEKLIPLTILNALDHKPLPIYGDGQQVRDWLYVEDHVNALDSLLSKGQIGESYCIGSENEMANLDIVKKICAILDTLKSSNKIKSYAELIHFVKDRPGHDFRYATNADKIKDHTGWTAKTPFEEGLEKTVQWYIKHHEHLSNLSQDRERIGLG